MEGATARPSLTFIVGTGVVTLVFVGATLVFLCCYHWAQLLKDTAEQQAADSSTEHHPHHHDDEEVDKGAIVITIHQMPCKDVPVVFMPHNSLMPTFIALPSPFLPLHTTSATITALQVPHSSPPPESGSHSHSSTP